ncbi:hypothetical protein NE236_18560 [Actinoallomurus purpureus]|uniref:hypothetical protein n=1 Tax=Actinoallomurus purpureus TaxID=478114 RepID=UPI0020930346|nr:hypothetical protein [Actinoallomurus purpureus]MCO6006993.1 hypothetical protein [Actinoallomurus purpureus]
MEVFGVRVAGLTVEDLGRLRCVSAWALAEELIGEETWLAAEGWALSEVLYELIGRGIPPEAKGSLVALRRAVHAGRRPPNQALQFVPDQIAARVGAWLVRLERCEELTARLPEVLADDVAASMHAAGVGR